MFTITGGKGFHITFANGYSVSVQFGKGNYCERRGRMDEVDSHACKNAEVAAWDKDGKWYKLPDSNDDVIGWQTPEQVLAILVLVAAL